MDSTTSAKTEISMKIIDGGTRKIFGKSMGIIRFQLTEFPIGGEPGIGAGTKTVEMVCHANYRDSIIKNLRRLRPVPHYRPLKISNLQRFIHA